MRFPSLYEIKKALLTPRTLYLRHREALEPGFLRSAMELHYYRPTFYRWLGAVHASPDLLYEADLNQNSVVLDIGAYTGEWAAEIDSRYQATIHAFEPDPRNFAQLNRRFASNTRLILHNYGLGRRSEQLPMALKHLGSNVYDTVATNEAHDWANVQILDIADVWQQLALAEVSLMKINIEGAEFSLLERMLECDLLSIPDCYLIQFHEWHPGAYRRRKAIAQALSKSHKQVWGYHFIWEKWVRH